MKTCSLVRAMVLGILALGARPVASQTPLAGPITNAANAHWYYLLGPTNWNAAEQIAVNLGGHLATINNVAENQWIYDTFGAFGGTERTLWLGFNDAGQENIWFWVGGAPATYVNWAPGEPNNGGGYFPNEDQALMWHPSSGYPHGSWADAPEDQFHAAVVEVSAPEPMILSGPITNAVSGHWYYLLNYTNWPGAEQIAVSLGGHLATINDAAENQWIYDQFSTFGGIERSLWIGLNDAASEGTWVWVSGEPVTFLNWSPIEPNSGGGVFPDEDHAMMWHPSSGFPLGSWNDGPSNHVEYAAVEVAPPSPPPTPQFVEQANPFPPVRNGSFGWVDFDNDGDLDLLVTGNMGSVTGATTVARMFLNNAGAFTDAGLQLPRYRSSSADWADFDNDGFLDLALTGLTDYDSAGTRVLRNVGGTNLVPFALLPGVYDGNAAWGDFNQDGFPDLAITGASFSGTSICRVFVNQRGTNFALHAMLPPEMYYGSADWADYDRDGDLDLVVAGESNSSGTGAHLFQNNEGQFSNVGRIVSGSGLRAQWFSEDNDGWPDLFVTVHSSGTFVLRNLPGGGFSTVANLPMLGQVAIADCDNDGFSDALITGYRRIPGTGFVYDRTSLFFNSATNRWAEVTNGFAQLGASVAAWGDYDRDGRLDLVLMGQSGDRTITYSTHLYQNTSARTNHLPSTPSNLSARATPFGMLLSWDEVTDPDQAGGLTYNVRLGTSPGAGDIVSPGSSPDGYRRVVRCGNAGYRTDFLIRGLHPGGTYHWSVQSVDNAFAGSPFAAEGSFVAQLLPPEILTQPRDVDVHVGGDVSFSVEATGAPPLAYQWQFNGTNLVAKTSSALELNGVQFNQAGAYSMVVSNAGGSVTSSPAWLIVLPPPSCTNLFSGLISWWPADGHSLDAMGANHISSFSPSIYTTGKVDRAFSFNGTSSRIIVPSSTSMNFGSNADFSIEMWIRTGATNAANPNVPLFEKRSESTPWIGYSLSLNQGRLAFALRSTSPGLSSVSTFVSSGPDLRDSLYHHIAVSLHRNPTNPTNGGNLYVDGQLVLSFDPGRQVGSLANSTSLYMGAPSTTVSNSYFFGQIDEPAIYNRALSAEEILAIRNAGAAGKCKTPPSILVQPVSQRVTIGSNATLSVEAGGSPPLRYQWFKTHRPGGPIAGATNSKLVITIVSLLDADSYYCHVTNLFGSVLSSLALLTMNYAPTAFGPNVVVDEDASTNITVTGFDQNLDSLTFIIVTPPQHGTLSPFVISPGDVATFGSTTYTPAPNYHGSDSFTFKVNDGLVDSTNATVNITVLSVNDPPVAFDQSLALDEDLIAPITLAATDVDGDPLTFTVSAPAHGTLTGTAPNLVYHPAINYFGPDSFTFSVSDGQTNSNTATVSLTIRPVNDAPFAEIVLAPLSHLPGVTNLLVIAPVGSNALVYLDGSRSTDVEDDPLQYFWSEGTNILATGMLATNAFPPGLHTITLVVSDGQSTGTNSVVLEVQSAAGAVGTLITLLEAADLSRRNAQPLLASLNSAAASFERGNVVAGINELQAFQNKVRAQIAPLDPELAAELIAAAQEIIDALSAPAVSGAPLSRLNSPTRQAGGKFQLRFHAPRGRAYFVEASRDLKTWVVIGVARDAGQDGFDFEDVHAARFPGRFYRVAAP